MSSPHDPDELIARLAAEDSSTTGPEDATLAPLRAELETIENQIRQPRPADPLLEESAYQRAAAQVVELGRELSHATRQQLEQPAPDQPPLGELGHYKLLEKLGEGGMGAVYKAVHTRLKRVVALKVLPKERLQDDQAVARFQREMWAVGTLQHPNIVAAHDAGEIDGTHYLVMELVEGTDLGKLVSEHGPLPINAACELIRQAALGLQHAFEHNLVHRDIKPSNLMLAAPANAKGSPTVKILDLGLALLDGNQIDAGELTSTGQVMGTLDYMAPEQGTDTHSVDIRADIYSLGASLYKLLTGRAPFGDPQFNSPIKKLMALANQAPKPVESLRPNCPPALSQLIARMLSKSPEERPTPPEELAILLEPFAQGANLHALLKPASQASTVHRQEMTVRTQHTAGDPTFIPSTPVDAAAATRVASTISATPSASKRRLMLGLGGVAAALVMGVVIWIATDRGTVAIEASDDLAEQIQVKLLRDGAEYNPNWRIIPGKTNLTSVRSGKVEIMLPDDGNEYELIKPAELVVRRGKSVVFKLSRIDKNAAAVAAVQTAAAPDYELDISGKTEAGFARVEIPDELPLDGPCTVEMYATARTVAPIGFNEGFFSSVGGLTLKIADKDPQEPGKTGKTWQLAYAPSEGPPDVIQSGPVAPGRRVHLAGVFTRDKLKLFLDGRLVATTRLSKPPARPTGMVSIGYNTTSENWRIFDGTIDEVRISTVARYVNDFTPAPRFESDDHTWGLYHCDEGSGAVLKDASGHGHDGNVIGATWKLRGGSSAAEPSQINEPPSLADWLKGRKRLTVAQDGHAEFTTISAALKALKPGQVVQVLDKGPYLERLELLSVPADVGLISEARTIIEVKELKDAGWQSGGVDVYEAHHLFDLDGFRLHGFHFVFPDASEQIHGPGGFQCCGFKVGRPGGLVVENCRFEGHCPAFTWDSLGLAFMENSSTRPVCVRDCVIEGGLRSDSTPTAEPPTVLITRNYLWKLTDERPNVKIYGGSFGKLGLHRNIFDGQAKGADLEFDAKIEDLEIRNNTLNSQKPIMFHQFAPGTVTIENNLCTKPGIVVFSEAPEDEYQRAAKTWRVGHNSYPRPIDAAHSLGKTDLSVRETLLSYDRENRDYFRLSATADSAKGGAGGDWPEYIGALTPGPAPATGDWFTRLREKWFELPGVAPEPASPQQPDEPPPLADWLKGRKELTVAQDGSGKFKTIQSALEALQPGEIVRVLDRGPYRERISVWSLPEDTGLISDQQTILELPSDFVPEAEPGSGHVFGPLKGFRLNGFALICPSIRKVEYYLNFANPNGLVLENCLIQLPENEPAKSVMLNWYAGAGPMTGPGWVRDCMFRGKLIISSGQKTVDAWIERNDFQVHGEALFARTTFGKLVIRHNVFSGPTTPATIWINEVKDADLIEISNNTILSTAPCLFGYAAPNANVTVRNNLHTHPGLLAFDQEAAKNLPALVSKWRVDHNAYPRQLRQGELGFAALFPQASGDVLGEPTLLSLDASHPGYLRFASNSPLAKGGAGGTWPEYIGAFPPGPAPIGGDWFTRLREHWPNSGGASGPRIEDPPPLAEWLKDRKVLAVAQDGSGQFKTIQSALEAVQPGQVVKVLDPGPYRERLKLRLPENVGLVSDCGTTIDLPAWDNTDSESYGHRLTDTRGFRLSGIRFSISTQPEAALGYLCVAENSQGLVVENCAFIGPDAGKPIFGLHARDFGPDIEAPLVVRENLFDFSELRCSVSSGARAAPVIIERNYIRQPRTGSCIYIQGPHRQVFIWHNILTAGSAAFGITVQPSSGQRTYDSLQALEICNNTIPSPGMNAFATAAPSKNVKIQNNILVPFKFLYGAEEEDGVTRARENWTIGQNCHAAGLDKNPRAGTVLSSSPNDLAIRPEFLSEDRSERDYLRIPANSQLANAGKDMHLPRYIGALTPGPAPSDGDWFTRLGERWLNPPAVPVTAKKPTLAAEPAPLADWLKGRTVLTVAQDGSARFKTIQAALDALQPGQVVNVLDKGPYRERLRLNNPSADVGLISDQQAVLELPDWEIFRQPAFDYRFGHTIQSARGFRLSGFALMATSDGTEHPHSGVYFQGSEGVVVEDCKFVFTDIQRNADIWHKGRFAISFSGFGGDVNQFSVVRDCSLDGGLGATCWPNRIAAPILFTRNLIRPWGNGTGILVQGWMRKGFIRNNVVVAAPPSQGIQLRINPENTAFESIDVTNNTVVGSAENRLQLSVPNSEFTIHGNVLLPFRLADGAEKHRARLGQWNVANNWYHVAPESMPDSENLVFRRPDDPVAEPKFLTIAPDDRDFARVTAIDGIAAAGALPPGPAPAKGDWFTRLRERWGELKPSRTEDESDPTQIPEPPPLAEWLKGRAVLTVAQDGSGDVTTIQAALDRIQKGQAVRVLDRGPYQLPALRYETLPEDVGLVSTNDTVLELTGAQTRESGKGKFALQFFNLRGFRLHGFRFEFQGGEDYAALAISNSSAVLIEDCLFQREVSGTGATADLLLSDWDPAVPPVGPRVRRCVFSGELSLFGSLMAPTVVEECWFRYTGKYSALTMSRLRNGAIVRRNVFETDKGAMYVEFRPGTGPVEISNNFIDAQPISVEQPAESRVVFVNNVVATACYPKVEPASIPDVVRKWEVANNAYRRAAYSPKQLPLQPTDLDGIEGTALDRTSPDYARVQLDSPLAQKGAGGKWPNYIGALPPGPAAIGGDWFSRLRERWNASAVK